MTALMNYRWPGNVRELQHAVERAVIMAHGPSIRVRELPPEVTQKSRHRAGDDTLDLQEQERVMIERALARFRRQSPASRGGAENQYRDALAEDEAVRPFILKSSFDSKRSPPPHSPIARSAGGKPAADRWPTTCDSS